MSRNKPPAGSVGKSAVMKQGQRAPSKRAKTMGGSSLEAGRISLAGHTDTLRERAKLLASRAVSGADKERSTTYLIFQLANRRFAFTLSAIEELVRNRIVTRVPGTPPEILGVANLRGDICPVLSLHHLLGLSMEQSARGGNLMYLKAPVRPVGIVIDQTIGIRTVFDSTVSESGSGGGLAVAFKVGLLPDSTIVLDHRPIRDLVAPVQHSADTGHSI